MTVSVCTLAHGRAAHLRNLVLGLREASVQPSELIIAVMQGDGYDLPDTEFPIQQIVLGAGDISLAQGRNAAAGAASGDLLIFQDVDCIAHRELIADYCKVARDYDGVFMGEVGYLPRGATVGERWDYDAFERVAIKHSERPGPPEAAIGICRDYRCFWSLNFALTKATFERIGGFDGSYTGYGGEDTDFSRMIAELKISLWWVRGAKAYHQQHAHHMPPVHHLDSVLANAAIFQNKWGEPTMQHWLRAFRLMGLVERDGDGFRKLREPNEADRELTRQQVDQPYASSAVVLENLEDQAAKAGSIEGIAAA